jgi:hypothetical protein
MWYVFWYESGTGDKCMAGPFDNPEQARLEPLGRLYPPVHASITIFQRNKTDDHDSLQ